MSQRMIVLRRSITPQTLRRLLWSFCRFFISCDFGLRLLASFEFCNTITFFRQLFGFFNFRSARIMLPIQKIGIDVLQRQTNAVFNRKWFWICFFGVRDFCRFFDRTGVAIFLLLKIIYKAIICFFLILIMLCKERRGLILGFYLYTQCSVRRCVRQKNIFNICIIY